MFVYSGVYSIGHGGTCPHFYKWLGTGGTLSRKTTNKKLTKLYCPSRTRSPKRLIVLVEPKKVEGHDNNKNFRHLAPDMSHFQIRSAATVCI